MDIAKLAELLVFSFGVILIFCAVLESIELVELLVWRRASELPAVRQGTQRPFVSLHVPICSEPPDVVAKTLTALRDLDYEAFEVLVIDNNTRDDSLWKPVEQLCGELGPRFRFFHLPVWPGFKAGALNFALSQTSPQARLVGIIDADYESAPNYLADIVGHFEDDKVAFVQTPQDYRNWDLGGFFRVCHWEYWQVFAVSMVLRNRRNAILMHGTMSLVRKDALVRAGGWAEWCLTEDSELGLRILAAGSSGIYVSQTYGRGLLPFTYRDYKRQRRRWVIGGAQQLKRHLHFFLPWSRGTNRLTPMQRLHYLQGWLPWFRDGVVVVSLPLGLAAAIASLVGLARPGILDPLGIGLASVLLQVIVRQAIIYRSHFSLSWRDTLGAMAANCSLTWAVGCGWLAGLLGREQVFQRTPKRPQAASRIAGSARAELLLGLLSLVLALAVTTRFGVAATGMLAVLLSYAAFLLPAAGMVLLAARSGRAGVAETEGRKVRV
jgi:cellulose synthase/poly-beta-1,6-N-acetylglucosamine synthase-like glycosyltransferase